MIKDSVNTGWLFLSFLLLVLSSCNNRNEINVDPNSKPANDEVWFKQADLSLGHRILMINSEKGFAISRGKGDPDNGGDKGGLYTFESGEVIRPY